MECHTDGEDADLFSSLYGGQNPDQCGLPCTMSSPCSNHPWNSYMLDSMAINLNMAQLLT